MRIFFLNIPACLCRWQCLYLYPYITDAFRLSLAKKICWFAIHWLVAFSLVIAMLTRHIDMPVILSKSMFHRFGMAGIYTVHDFALLIAAVTKIFVAVTESRFLLCVGERLCCLLLYGYYNYRHPQVTEIDVPLISR